MDVPIGAQLIGELIFEAEALGLAGHGEGHVAMWLGMAVVYGALAHRRPLDQTSVARQQYQAATLR